MLQFLDMLSGMTSTHHFTDWGHRLSSGQSEVHFYITEKELPKQLPLMRAPVLNLNAAEFLPEAYGDDNSVARDVPENNQAEQPSPAAAHADAAIDRDLQNSSMQEEPSSKSSGQM